MILNQQQPSRVPLPRHLTGARVWALAGACLCVDSSALAVSLRSGGCALACARLCARAGARPCARAGARPCGPCRDRKSPGPCRDPCPCRDRDRGPCRDRDCGCGAPASPFVFCALRHFRRQCRASSYPSSRCSSISSAPSGRPSCAFRDCCLHRDCAALLLRAHCFWRGPLPTFFRVGRFAGRT